MTREQIEKQYNKLVSEIEEKRMYDGRGTVDRYVCDTCGYIMHTTYKDKGVTPFTMCCPKCKGTMYHKKTFRKETVPSWVEVKHTRLYCLGALYDADIQRKSPRHGYWGLSLFSHENGRNGDIFAGMEGYSR